MGNLLASLPEIVFTALASVGGVVLGRYAASLSKIARHRKVSFESANHKKESFLFDSKVETPEKAIARYLRNEMIVADVLKEMEIPFRQGGAQDRFFDFLIFTPEGETAIEVKSNLAQRRIRPAVLRQWKDQQRQVRGERRNSALIVFSDIEPSKEDADQVSSEMSENERVIVIPSSEDLDKIRQTIRENVASLVSKQ